MFNNPFHNLAADSKSEREQLDRLLRITAPHEQIAVAGIGLVVVGFVAWAIFGNVVRSVTLDGVLIAPGERHAAIAEEPGQLLRYLVRPGDIVREGQSVARQSVPELERETIALRERMDLLQADIARAGGASSALPELLASIRVALLQMEAQRSARQTIVSRNAGEVMTLFKTPGDFLPAGAAVAQIREAANGPLQAVSRVDRTTAERIRTGMTASVEVALPGGATRQLSGTVVEIVTEPLPDWLARLEPAVLPSWNRVDVHLEGLSDLSVPDGTICRIRIELGRRSLVSLIHPGRS